MLKKGPFNIGKHDSNPTDPISFTHFLVKVPRGFGNSERSHGLDSSVQVRTVFPSEGREFRRFSYTPKNVQEV